ncbi:MAG: helix-turn-helix domain-containing protein [Clostridia bacterium]|nr:helix-turn-helix domain-containing protein [Clostridia bacterium]
MDSKKAGGLIRTLRLEKNMTQMELAQALHISDKTVSKWERGLGCPDISLLPALSKTLGVPIDKLLSGDLMPNRPDGGNMKKTKFYRCPACGNVLVSTGGAEISCCGRPLSPLQAHKADEAHGFTVEPLEDELYIRFNHPMEKEHFISFVACVNWDKALLARLYPEQGNELRIPFLPGAKIYLCCSEHGLMEG